MFSTNEYDKVQTQRIKERKKWWTWLSWLIKTKKYEWSHEQEKGKVMVIS